FSSIAGSPTYTWTFSSFSLANSAQFTPRGVSVDSSNNLYMVNASAQHKIYEVASASNTLINSWTMPSAAYEIAVDSHGNLYVPANTGTTGIYEYVPGLATNAAIWTGVQGGGHLISQPYGIVFLPSGDLLVDDQSTSGYIQKFTP